MTPEEWEKVSEIFDAASALPEQDVAAFLDKECDGAEHLRPEIESLLAANRKAGNFISEPLATGFAAELFKAEGLSVNDTVGPYRLVSKLGVGGMGEVFLAEDTNLRRNVAIKTLSSVFNGDDSFLKRFRNEARAAANLNHPNVATVYSVDEYNGRPFIALEYVDGKTLDALVPKGGLDLRTFVDWFIPIAEALGHAHDRGVIHRDIKPGNIMVAGDGKIKILDFGLACFDPSSNLASDSLADLTHAGQVLGTPSYMSPEQAAGKEVDQRSDIFSMGVVMYEALTGAKPFRGDSNAEVIGNLMKTTPPSVGDLRPDVPTIISELIDRCLQKRPADRFQNMHEVESLLQQAKASLKSNVSTGSFGRRLYRETSWGGWRPRAAAAIGVTALAIASWFYFSREVQPPIDFDRMTMKRLSDANNVGFVQISPDGKSIAFATFEDDGTRALWFRRIDNRNAIQLVPLDRVGYWGGLTISDDGGQVYYITAQRTANFGTLYRVSSLGGPPRKLVEMANDVGGLSPDGSRLLFVRYGNPGRVLSVNSSDGTDERVIVEIAATPTVQAHYRDPKFSADGKSVYYIKGETIDGTEHWSVENVTIESGHVRRIYEQPGRISELAVLQDSSGLFMTATAPDSNLQQLYHLSLVDGTKTRVTNDLNLYFGVSVDREGHNIVVSQRSDQQKIWVGEASDLSALKPLSSQPKAFRNVDWSPDGRIVFDGFENNVADIWIADADGKNLQKLTEGNSDNSEPKVSGDGRFIVFTSRRSGRNQVWRMDLDGANQVLLADVAGITQAPRFLADGRTVVFEWIREGSRVLGSVDVYGGSAVEFMPINEIPGAYSYYWASSPDGKYIASSIWDAGEQRMKVGVRATDSGEVLHLLNIWPSLILKWSLDSKILYYRERQVGYVPESEVLMIDPVVGKSDVLLSTAPEYITDITYSRDGKRVAIVRGSNTSNAVILTAASEKK